MDHAATIGRMYDLLNAGDVDGFGDLLADDFVEHEELPGSPRTKDGVKDFFRMYIAAFPEPADDRRGRSDERRQGRRPRAGDRNASGRADGHAGDGQGHRRAASSTSSASATTGSRRSTGESSTRWR